MMDIQAMENFWHEGKARIAQLERSNKELREALKLANGAMFDADHLSVCSERMLAALNRKHAAVERCEVADMGDIGAPARAQAELEAAEADVSEYWRAIQSAASEYRKRAERFRAALSAADAKGEKNG
jgi:hypothetical protein